jgi:hypothetical protein
MQIREGVNGFEAVEIDAAVLGASGVVERGLRFDLLDEENRKIRPTSNVISGFWQQSSKLDVKGGGQAVILEQKLKMTDDYIPPDAQDNEELELSTLLTQVTNEAAIGFWRQGETSGTTMGDATGNGHNGTYTGGVTLNQRSLCEGALTNGAALYDGVNDYGTVPHSAAFNVSRLSVGAWAKSSQTTVRQNIVSRDDTSTNRQFILRTLGSSTDTGQGGYLELVLFFSGPTTVRYTTSVNVCDGRQHYCAATYDGAFVRIYIDGALVYKLAETRALLSVTAAMITGSLNGGGSFFSGTIDEVEFYGTALTQAQITARWQAGSGQLYEINFLRYRMKVYARIKMLRNGNDGTPWAEFAICVCRFIYSKRRKTGPQAEYDCQLQDLGSLLKLQKATSRYVVSKSVTYRAALTALFTLAGIPETLFSITTSTVAEQNVATERVYPIKTPLLQIFNDLLAAMNYRSLYFNQDGVAICEPKVLTSARAVDYTYTPNAKSVIVNKLEQSVNLADTINQMTMVKMDAKGNVALTSTKTNNNRSHPTSVPSLGYTVPDYEVVDAADQTTIDAKCQQALEDRSQISYGLDIETPINPFHGNEDIIRIPGLEPPPLFAVSTALIPENFVETGWKILFNDISKMTHQLEFVYPV